MTTLPYDQFAMVWNASHGVDLTNRVKGFFDASNREYLIVATCNYDEGSGSDQARQISHLEIAKTRFGASSHHAIGKRLAPLPRYDSVQLTLASKRL